MAQMPLRTPSPVDAWWFMSTCAEVELAPDGRTATLSAKGKRLTARILDPSPGRFEVMPAEPMPSSPNPSGQHSNRGVSKLAIHLAGIAALRLDVELAPGR